MTLTNVYDFPCGRKVFAAQGTSDISHSTSFTSRLPTWRLMHLALWIDVGKAGDNSAQLEGGRASQALSSPELRRMLPDLAIWTPKNRSLGEAF